MLGTTTHTWWWFLLTDLRRQLCDGVLGDLQDGELGEQRQERRQPADPRPADVPLSQVRHPLQLPGEVLEHHPLISISMEKS